jgi:hypothetical protein
MRTGEKVLVGALGLAALGLGAWALWPKTQAAAPSPSTTTPTASAPVPIVLSDTQAAMVTGVSLAVNQPLILNLTVTGGGAPGGAADWTVQVNGGLQITDQGVSQGVHTFEVSPTGPGAAVLTITYGMPSGAALRTLTLPVTVAPTTQSFAPPAGAGTSGLPRHRMRQALQA